MTPKRTLSQPHAPDSPQEAVWVSVSDLRETIVVVDEAHNLIETISQVRIAVLGTEERWNNGVRMLSSRIWRLSHFSFLQIRSIRVRYCSDNRLLPFSALAVLWEMSTSAQSGQFSLSSSNRFYLFSTPFSIFFLLMTRVLVRGLLGTTSILSRRRKKMAKTPSV